MKVAVAIIGALLLFSLAATAGWAVGWVSRNGEEILRRLDALEKAVQKEAKP